MISIYLFSLCFLPLLFALATTSGFSIFYNYYIRSVAFIHFLFLLSLYFFCFPSFLKIFFSVFFFPFSVLLSSLYLAFNFCLYFATFSCCNSFVSFSVLLQSFFSVFFGFPFLIFFSFFLLCFSNSPFCQNLSFLLFFSPVLL